jgi:TM2 domain-containing membrane protein YozV
MSDNNKDLGDKAEDAMDNAKKKSENLGDKAGKSFDKGKEESNDTFERAKEKTEKAYDDAKESAKEFSEETKESAKEFGEGAKKTADEFTAGAKEAFGSANGENKKMLVGILAIILGSLGVHKFILGYQKEGFILLGVTILGYATTCFVIGAFFFWIPGVIGLIEGIIYLTKSDEEFYNTYQVGRKPWF